MAESKKLISLDTLPAMLRSVKEYVANSGGVSSSAGISGDISPSQIKIPCVNDVLGDSYTFTINGQDATITFIPWEAESPGSLTPSEDCKAVYEALLMIYAQQTEVADNDIVCCRDENGYYAFFIKSQDYMPVSDGSEWGFLTTPGVVQANNTFADFVMSLVELAYINASSDDSSSSSTYNPTTWSIRLALGSEGSTTGATVAGMLSRVKPGDYVTLTTANYSTGSTMTATKFSTTVLVTESLTTNLTLVSPSLGKVFVLNSQSGSTVNVTIMSLSDWTA